MTDETFEKMKKAQIKVQSRNPFFSYLSLFLTFKKEDVNNPLPKYAGMGVNAKGELTYKEEFVKNCSDEQLIGVLAHEILHLAFLHISRLRNRQQERWNIACDIAVNSILIKNNFKLPKGIIPNDYEDNIEIGGKIISEVSKKTAEKIYTELPEMKECKGGGKNGGSCSCGKCQERFDSHEQSKGQTPEEVEKEENEWLNRLDEAVCYAKQRGNMPNGMERWIEGLHKSKVNWKVMLRRYITNELPSDYNILSCSKKGFASGYWLPNTIKEKIDVMCVVDTSGSIGKEELTDFLSEIVGMSKAFQSQIDMRFLAFDTKIQNDLEMKNGNINKILKTKIRGGGGTDFEVVFNHIKKKKYKPQVMIFLTDGYGTRVTKQRFPIIWVLSGKNTDDSCIKGTGVILKINND